MPAARREVGIHHDRGGSVIRQLTRCRPSSCRPEIPLERGEPGERRVRARLLVVIGSAAPEHDRPPAFGFSGATSTADVII
jgi:hypothetical protein